MTYRLVNKTVYSAKGPVIWCSTVGGAPLEVVRRYVENQQQAA